MALTLYHIAGSPYAWRVWLALEHKGCGFTLKTLSASAGETRTPEFLALNPRHKVPVLVDGSTVLYESAAIVEYLDETCPGPRLFPGDAARRALVRRLVCEADGCFGPAAQRVNRLLLYGNHESADLAAVEAGVAECLEELTHFEREVGEGFLAGPLSAADFALYTSLALWLRCEKRRPELALRDRLPPGLSAWMKRVEALPYFARTWPAHWK